MGHQATQSAGVLCTEGHEEGGSLLSGDLVEEQKGVREGGGDGLQQDRHHGGSSGSSGGSTHFVLV